MSDPNAPAFLPYFPLLFVAMWLVVTTVLSLTSGWFSLMERYPDRIEEPTLVLRAQSGSMGIGVNMNGILRLSVCPSGLRVGMLRLFGVFARDFLVPWEEIHVRRTTWFFMPFAELTFGLPSNGRLSIRAHIADRLARAAGDDWPEPGPFPPEPIGQIFWSVARQWAIGTAVLALVLTVMLGQVSEANPRAGLPPLVAMIGIVAVFVAIVNLFEFLSRVLNRR